MNGTAVIRRTGRSVAVGAIVALCTLGGQGVADAYPPTPPTDEKPVGDTPTKSLPASPSGTLPQTGGPGTTQILGLAAAALAGGVVVSGVAARSRRRTDAVT